jgi:hypothetical protein
VLAEVYDAESSPTATTPRLVNISGKARVGTGADNLILGFVIKGTSPKTVLVRAIGPTLGAAPFNVPGTLGAPRLDLYNTRFTLDEIIASNAAWTGAAALKSAFTRTGAFSLSSDSSKDAVLLVTLPPGSYTAVVNGMNSTTGVALVEIYEVE